MASRRRAAEQRRSYFTGLPGLLLFSGTRRRVLGGEQVNRRSDCSEADLLVRTGLLVLLRRCAARPGAARSSHRPGPPLGGGGTLSPNRTSARFLLEIWKYEVSVDEHHSDMTRHEGETWENRKRTDSSQKT